MKELNLTQGNVPKVLLQFAVPFLIANILQALYGGADLFVVGQYDDSASVAAVAIGSQVMQTITGIILGITTGTTVLIAIATGSKDNRQVASTIGSSVWLFSIIGVVLTLTMTLYHSQIAEWMHTPSEAMSDTKKLYSGLLNRYSVYCGIQRCMWYPTWFRRFKNSTLFRSIGVCYQYCSRLYISRIFPSWSYWSSHCHRNGTRSQFCHRTLVPLPKRVSF